MITLFLKALLGPIPARPLHHSFGGSLWASWGTHSRLRRDLGPLGRVVAIWQTSPDPVGIKKPTEPSEKALGKGLTASIIPIPAGVGLMPIPRSLYNGLKVWELCVPPQLLGRLSA